MVGDEVLEKIIKEYFKEWKFKHPRPNDFKRIAERVSGLELDWYLVDWTQTTNTIDYGIKDVVAEKKKTKITLERKGFMPMPVEVLVTYDNNTSETFYIPLQMMRGEKTVGDKTTILKDWAWAHPTYEFYVLKSKRTIKSVKINVSGRMADINELNDSYKIF